MASPDQAVGCLIGGAIGDAMGGPYENEIGPVVVRDWGTGTISDDTQLTIATCEAICRAGMSSESIAEELVAWYRARRLSGVGASTLGALRFMAAGGHWASAGAQGERSAGNGAATRAAPLAFVCDPDVESERALIRDACRITHRSDEAYVGALAVIAAIRSVVRGIEDLSGGDWLVSVATKLPDTRVRDRLVELAALNPRTPLIDIADGYGCSGWVVDSVPLALFAAQRVTELPFEELLASIVKVGGDTDTNAAIAGQVAGTLLGFERLPQHLVAKINGSDELIATFREFGLSVAT